MFAVEIYAAVRRFVFVEGKSRREAARVFGLSRDTIAKMCRYSAPPGYVRSKAPERPKLGLAGGQEYGRRKRGSLASAPRRSCQTWPEDAGTRHRRRRPGAGCGAGCVVVRCGGSTP